MTLASCPLFDWQPSRQVIVFPMTKRVGRIRDVAIRMLDKPTDRAAAFYRKQVTDSLLRGLDKIGIPERERDEQLGAFWEAVQAEMIRLTHYSPGPGGTA